MSEPTKVPEEALRFVSIEAVMGPRGPMLVALDDAGVPWALNGDEWGPLPHHPFCECNMCSDQARGEAG